MTGKGFALAASIIAFSAISGLSYAKTAIHHEKHDRVERSILLPEMQPETSNSFASMRSNAPEHDSHVYHGGPKSND
jgi:hypothetical protein